MLLLLHERAGFYMNGYIDLGSISPLRYFLVASVLLGIVIASVAPEHTGNQFVLYIQWIMQTLIAVLLLLATQYTLSKVRGFSKLNLWAQLLISGLFASLLFTPIALAIDRLIENDPVLDGINQSLFDEFLGVAPTLITAWLGLNFPLLFGYQFRLKSENVAQENLTDKSNSNHLDQLSEFKNPFFLALIQEKIQVEDIIVIKSDLHYLTVKTVKTKSLILYNLKDAIAELPKEQGTQVHRSYWVSYRHIQDFKRRGREGELTLAGDTIPVSRRYVKFVEDVILSLNVSK